MDYDEHQRGQPQPGTALPAVKDTPAMRRVLLALLGAAHSISREWQAAVSQ